MEGLTGSELAGVVGVNGQALGPERERGLDNFGVREDERGGEDEMGDS